jgi:hypothetical protein
MTFRNKIGCGLLGFAAGLGLFSCNSESETYETSGSNDAVLTAFSLSDNDSVCSSLSSYAFTIDQYGISDVALSEQWGGAGIIFNSDSLPVGSVPDSVVVSLSYSSPSSVLFYQFDAGGQALDTVNFATQTYLDLSRCAYTKLVITAEDLITTRSYMLKINVHTVEGDTVHWKYATQSVWSEENLTDQRVEQLGDHLYWYLQSGDDASGVSQTVSVGNLEGSLAQWSSPENLNIVSSLNLQTIYSWNDCLYGVSRSGGKLLVSTDGANWKEVASSLDFVNILGVSLKTRLHADVLIAIVRQSEEYYFASSTDGTTWSVGEAIPENFPIEGYTRPISIAARPSLGTVTSRLYIVGGKTADGTLVSSTWTCDGSQWAEFKQPYLPAMSGAAIARYTLDTDTPDTFWVLLAGETETGCSNTLYFSENYGVTWRQLSLEHTAYADNSALSAAAYASVFCTSDYRICRFGGRDSEGKQVTDIATGQLIKLTFQKRR